ncbi:5-dehydro-4-deoxy-D-glucuronate isomerase [Microvirga alba]|uniref:4-deoxy-L-threo-5-hexosulose-uronate ketol-isomerase n=1 Tax=Microvirga alba TaxID=2791025 RepID=A0A931BNC4_9HYPH|nr:5-dehydro-4-deoxy-D-glucuronate isomerase [Microvirga alba]MBF9232455.1 5-dehydro-4-deoxy-D-glucuronate isomerase [Microvirga alba]
MEVRQAIHHEQAETLDTEGLRRHFLIEEVFAPGEIRATYTHYDRLVILGISPLKTPLTFGPELAQIAGVSDFMERRELALINISAGAARVSVDGQSFIVENEEALYIGRGAADVSFTSVDPARPAKLYAVSAPAHARHPHRKVTKKEASPQPVGTAEAANKRTINKYIHADLLPTCQLMMGLTRFEPGSVWNTMPAHTHDRRTEAYLYFDMPSDRLVIHLMGRPCATRHLIVRNEQAVLSPPWSIHSGSGTGSYAFIWAMAGDNQSFTDMDFVPMEALK